MTHFRLCPLFIYSKLLHIISYKKIPEIDFAQDNFERQIQVYRKSLIFIKEKMMLKKIKDKVSAK